MLSPIVTFNEDGTAHIELGGGHLFSYHFYDNTDEIATVVEALGTVMGCKDRQHRVVGVWSGRDQIYGSSTIAYALAGGVKQQVAPIFAALSDVTVRVGGYKVASMVTTEELDAITDRAHHLMNMGALSPTPHNLMAHTTKDTA
jgi:hypothetical protein